MSTVLLSCLRSIVKIAVGLENQINSEQKTEKEKKKENRHEHTYKTNKQKQT